MKTPQHRRAAMLLTRTAGLLTSTNEKILSPYGLTPVSWGVLLKISKKPGQSTHALAELCLLADQAIGQIVAKLAKQGLVERTPTFGRAIIHEVTEKGQRLLDDVEPFLDAGIKDYFSELTKKELTELNALLEKVVLRKASEELKQHIREFNENG